VLDSEWRKGALDIAESKEGSGRSTHDGEQHGTGNPAFWFPR